MQCSEEEIAVIEVKRKRGTFLDVRPFWIFQKAQRRHSQWLVTRRPIEVLGSPPLEVFKSQPLWPLAA